MDERIMAQMVADADEAKEPGTLKTKDFVSTDEMPMMVAELTSPKYVYIYDTVTREASVCSLNMLEQHLKLKRPGGSFVFTTKKPDKPPARGHLKCMLHPSGPNRKHYDELGLPACNKANLTSPFQVRRHMEKRHRQEWATIENERVEAEKQRDRDFQERMLTQVGMGREFKTPKKK